MLETPLNELVIFGDIFPSFIARCVRSLELNYSVGGARVRNVCKQILTSRENHQQAVVTNVIIHVGTNRLPRNHPSDIKAKIST